MQADAHGIGTDPENLSRFRLAQTVPDQQTEQFLIVGSHPGEGFEGRCLDRVDCWDALELGVESEPEPEAAPGAAVLVGEDSAGGGQQPGERGFRLR